MNDVFHPLLDQCVVVYLDDILVFSKTPEEHEQHLRQVLQILRQHKLYAKLSKCAFFQPAVDFPGSHSQWRWHQHGCTQGQGHPGLASASKCQGAALLPGPCSVLHEVCAWPCSHRGSPHGPPASGYCMGLDLSATSSLLSHQTKRSHQQVTLRLLTPHSHSQSRRTRQSMQLGQFSHRMTGPSLLNHASSALRSASTGSMKRSFWRSSMPSKYGASTWTSGRLG